MKKLIGGLLVVCLILNWYTKSTLEQGKKNGVIKVAQQAIQQKKG